MTLVGTIARGVGIAPRQSVDSGSFGGDYPFVNGPEGLMYALQQTLVGNKETIGPNFLAFVQQAYKQSPIIFACVANRLSLFSEARLQFRNNVGRPGPLFGTPELAVLEKPWPNGTTGDLLAIAEVHNSVAGNFFCARRGGQLRVMRPDWTTMVLGSPDDQAVGPLDLDAEVIAYLYQEGGPTSGKEPILLAPEEVCHWYPVPDPEAPYRGMSWITPVIREVLADKAMTHHRKMLLDAGATPNLAVKLNITEVEKFNKWVDRYRKERENTGRGMGIDVNPYRTLFLGAASDVVPIGLDLQKLDFAAVQSAGEVRIAAAAGVHPSVAAFWAGLQGSALNAGNYEAAFRLFADGTIRWLWRSFAGALESVVNVPGGSQIWYDDRDIPALREDIKKQAETAALDARTVNSLVMAGFEPDAIIAAVTSKDFSLLTGQHTGLPSVQLQPRGTDENVNVAEPDPALAGSTNGAGP